MGTVPIFCSGLRVCVTALLLCAVSGCGGGGGGGNPPAATTATGTIQVTVVLTDPPGVTDFSGVSVSVSSSGSAPVTETTNSDGKLTFAGLKITNTTTGTFFTVSAVKTDYKTPEPVNVPLAKDGEVQSASLSLQFSAAKIVSQTWPLFSSADSTAEYLAALQNFEEAVTVAKTLDEISQSNTGHGWTCFLGFASVGDATCNYQTAKSSFEKAIATDNNPDAKVGLAFMLVDSATDSSSAFLADLETAIGHMEQVLSSPETSNYVFPYATRFNYIDLNATLAFAYAQKWQKTQSADDKADTCANADAVKKAAAAGTDEYKTAEFSEEMVGGCP